MITNCELPIQLLEKNVELNDFDFVLFHLYQSNETYRKYYQQIRKKYPRRLMVLDNSAYEFFVKGDRLDMDDFVKTIIELDPQYYILPDVLRDKDATLVGVHQFVERYGQLLTYSCSSQPIAVPQGATSDDLVDCIHMFKNLEIKYIGIPFHLPFYQTGYVADDIRYEFYTTYGEETDDIRYAMGRVQWVRDHEDLLKSIDKIHFLGSHCPLEKEFYKDYYSMDTGYPVKLGIQCQMLESEKSKPDVIIDDFLDQTLTNDQIQIIQININTFKNY